MLRLLSIVILLGAWYAGSLVAGERMLPGPAAVLAAIAGEARSGALALNLAATLARVALAFSLAKNSAYCSSVGAILRQVFTALPVYIVRPV